MSSDKNKVLSSFIRSLSQPFKTIKKHGLNQMQFWLIALMIGIASGFATLGFRLTVTYFQTLFYGESGEALTSVVEELPWFIVVGIPIVGLLEDWVTFFY